MESLTLHQKSVLEELKLISLTVQAIDNNLKQAIIIASKPAAAPQRSSNFAPKPVDTDRPRKSPTELNAEEGVLEAQARALIPLRIWAKDVAVLPVTADSDDEAAEMEVDD